MDKLLKILKCSKCGGNLIKNRTYIECIKCKRKYPLKNGVINMMTKGILEDKHNLHQKGYYDKEYQKEYANRDFEWRKRYKKRLVSFLPRNKKSIILDFAAGQGYMSLAIAKKGYDVIACDIAISGLERAYWYAKKLGIEKRILFIVGDINQIRFAKRSIDFVILLHVLEHMKKDREIMTKLFKFTKENAIYYIGVPLSLEHVFPLLRSFYRKSDKNVGHVRRYTIKTLQALFNKKGKLLSVIYTGHLIKFLGIIFSMIKISYFDKWIEDKDEKKLNNVHWASNITAVFQYNYD